MRCELWAVRCHATAVGVWHAVQRWRRWALGVWTDEGTQEGKKRRPDKKFQSYGTTWILASNVASVAQTALVFTPDARTEFFRSERTKPSRAAFMLAPVFDFSKSFRCVLQPWTSVEQREFAASFVLLCHGGLLLSCVQEGTLGAVQPAVK